MTMTTLPVFLHTIPFIIGKDVDNVQMGPMGMYVNFMPLSKSARVFL